MCVCVYIYIYIASWVLLAFSRLSGGLSSLSSSTRAGEAKKNEKRRRAGPILVAAAHTITSHDRKSYQQILLKQRQVRRPAANHGCEDPRSGKARDSAAASDEWWLREASCCQGSFCISSGQAFCTARSLTEAQAKSSCRDRHDPLPLYDNHTNSG